MSKTFTAEEVAKHNKDGDSWVIIDGGVYDVSKFAALHPGGKQVLLAQAGQESSDVFHLYHNSTVMQRYEKKFRIGTLEGYEKKKPLFEIPGTFGDMVPYGDPLWYQRFNSPYYKETHIQWRAKVREFVDNHILPTVETWKDKNAPPTDVYLKMGSLGLLAALTGPPWPTAYLPSEIKGPENFDHFHELILIDEISRCGYGAVIGALTNGCAIALPVVLKFGTEEMKKRVVPDILLGRKFIALAISEPHAGSDVAGMITTAKKTPDGKHYVLNGNKKWITNGTYSDYFATALVTGEHGQKGLSFLLIEKNTPGFSVRKVNVRDSQISGTAYLDFDNALVPVSNLIGKENDGFRLVMHNFNHERLYVSTICCRLARVCLEESIKYALKRKTFGKYLADHQAIRLKIAAMIRQVEMLQTWLDYVTYQLTTMTHAEANEKVGDVISLLKAQCSKTYELCARETTNIFGGNALYMDGVGRKIEISVAQVKGYQIPAGAEDIMDDFGARVAFKRAKALAKL